MIRRASLFPTLLRLLCALFTVILLLQSVAAQTADTPPDVQVIDAQDSTLDDWLWQKRPVVIFADSPEDPRFAEQIALVQQRLEALADREVVVLTDTDPAARNPIRKALRPRGFMLAIIAKDGTIVARKPAPWDVREISRSIDKLPLRQQEVRDRIQGAATADR